MSNILYEYANGNTNVAIYDDGTKIREYDGTASPIYPESIDVKITNWCDGKCSYCHEKSTVAGKHGDLNKLTNVLSVFPAGTEIAVGGGDALSHPDLLSFLYKLKEQGIICNITVNCKHIARNKDLLLKLLNEKLIMGLGISYSNDSYLNDMEELVKASSNIVFHLIMGINTVEDVNALYEFTNKFNKKCKVLVLGYKQYGFGLNYYKSNSLIDSNKYCWYTKLASYFKKDNLVLSFDNLAINQLKLKRYFTDEAWNKFYMGEEGYFSMYIDSVEQKFAKSSTTPEKKSFSEISLIDFFKTLK